MRAILFLLSLPAWAVCTLGPPHCSAVLPTTQATAAVSSGSLGSHPMRLEFRLHGVNWAATNNSTIVDAGGFGVRHLGATSAALIFGDSPDTVSGGIGNFAFTVSWTSDMLFRVTRDVSGMLLSIETFNTQTGVSLGTASVAITALASSGTIQANGVQIGGTNTTGDIAFLRWYDSVVPLGTAVPVAVSSCAPLGDWEFENNGTDCSGLSQTMATISTYADTPIYSPSCNAGTQQTVRTGVSMSLSGANSIPLNGDITLSYAWSYFTGTDGVNQAPTITGPTTVTPSVSGLNLFGSADFQLIVTDSSANSSTCTIHNGVVFADSRGLINLTSEGLDATSQKLIGPLIMYSANPWPWADQTQKYTLDLQTTNLANNYTPYWRTNLAGTISVINGSAAITGTGTTFKDMCGGGSTPLQDAGIILTYPGTDSRTHYVFFPLVTCTDDTHVTMSVTFQSSMGAAFPSCASACTGWHWNWGYNDVFPCAHSIQCQYYFWRYGPAPGEYYCNSCSFKGLYLSSGIDNYETQFQALADEWWEIATDQGYGCNASGAYDCVAPVAWRSLSLTGTVLRALEEGPSSPKWAGLRVIWPLANSYLNSEATNIPSGWVDGRETGYALSALAYCALADPDGTQATTCKTQVKNQLAAWITPFARTDSTGTWWGAFDFNPNFSPSQVVSFAGVTESCSVVNGSTSVTCTGTNFVSGMSSSTPGTGSNFWTFDAPPGTQPVDNTHGDAIAYTVTVNSTTTLTISPAYQGATQSGRGFAFGFPQGASNGFVGWGAQLYPQGIFGVAMGLSALAMDGFDAPSATLYRTYMDDTVQFLINSGTNPGLGGLYNGVNFVGCLPPVSSMNVPCYPNAGSPTPQNDTRSLALDVMKDYAMDYAITGNPAIKTAADLLMNQMFAKPGTCIGSPCSSDGFYLSGFDPGQLYVTGNPPLGTAPKWTGQLCGFEQACDMWPAVRLPALSSGGGGVIGSGVVLPGGAVP